MPTVAAFNDPYTLAHVATLTATANGSTGTYGVLHNDTGSGIYVSAVGGSSGAVGQQIYSSSGSSITLNADGGFSFTAGLNTSAPDVFAYDISDGTDTASATITLSVANNAPSVTDPGSKTAFAGDAISLQIAASDADSDTLNYSATGLPTGLSINSSTGVVSGTVSSSANTSEPYAVTVTVTDGFAGSASQSFSWAVNEAYVVVIQGDQYNIAGETVEVSLDSWKVADHTLTFSATGLPSGLSINSSTGVITGTIAYGEESSEPYQVTITATDSAGDAETEETFGWYVEAPVVTVFGYGNLESLIDADVEVELIAWSTDQSELAFSATGLPSGLSIDTETGVISGTIASNADTYSPYSIGCDRRSQMLERYLGAHGVS